MKVDMETTKLGKYDKNTRWKRKDRVEHKESSYM